MAYGHSPRLRGQGQSTGSAAHAYAQEPEQWTEESPQDEAFDTALHLASHAQRLKNMEGHFAQIQSNIRHMRFQFAADQKRQQVLMGILAGGFILSILITAFARPSAPSPQRAQVPPAARVAEGSVNNNPGAVPNFASGLAMAGAQLQGNLQVNGPNNYQGNYQGGTQQNSYAPSQAILNQQPPQQQMINAALQAPAPQVQPQQAAPQTQMQAQVPLYARTPPAQAPVVQTPVYAPPQQQAQPPVQALGRYDQQLPAGALVPPQPQYQQQPQMRPRSAFEQQVRQRLAAKGENMPPEWQAYFDRDSRGDRKGRLLVAGKFLKGDGVGRDQAYAIEIIRAAADEGEKEAMMWLAYANQGGNLGRADINSAVRWFEAAARAGVATANTELGRIFERGVDGVPDVETALAWYQRGKQAGDTKANEAITRLRDRPISQQASNGIPQASLGVDPAAQEIQRMVQAGGADAPQDGVFTPASPEPAYTARPVAASMPVPSAQVGMDPAEATADVRAAQRMLKALGYRIENVDGEFGPETATAIRTYQRDRALYPDGEPTPQLIEALSRDMRYSD